MADIAPPMKHRAYSTVVDEMPHECRLLIRMPMASIAEHRKWENHSKQARARVDDTHDEMADVS